MERSRAGAMRRETARIARTVTITGPAQAGAVPVGSSGVSAGAIDTATGEFVAYGLTGVTPIGSFQCAPGPKG